MNASETSPAQLDAIFGALSHEVRRSLIARLGRGSATIGELAAPFSMSLPAVSKHVRVLERAGLVSRSVEGRVHRCALDATPLANADAWLAHYRVFWTDSLASLAAFVESDDADEDEPWS